MTNLNIYVKILIRAEEVFLGKLDSNILYIAARLSQNDGQGYFSRPFILSREHPVCRQRNLFAGKSEARENYGN